MTKYIYYTCDSCGERVSEEDIILNDGDFCKDCYDIIKLYEGLVPLFKKERLHLYKKDSEYYIVFPTRTYDKLIPSPLKLSYIFDNDYKLNSSNHFPPQYTFNQVLVTRGHLGHYFYYEIGIRNNSDKELEIGKIEPDRHFINYVTEKMLESVGNNEYKIESYVDNMVKALTIQELNK